MPRAQNRAAEGSIHCEDETHWQSGYSLSTVWSRARGSCDNTSSVLYIVYMHRKRDSLRINAIITVSGMINIVFTPSVVYPDNNLYVSTVMRIILFAVRIL